MDGHLPMQIRPWKILNIKTYKHYESAFLTLTFSLYVLAAATS
jgi:hypothetical protein